MSEISQLMKARTGGGPADEETDRLQPVMVRYLTMVLGQAGAPVGMRNARELRTLAEALDLLTLGKIAEVGDVLMQRFKAVELASQEGNWRIAQHLELIPDTGVSASSYKERRAAAKLELEDYRLRKALGGPSLGMRPAREGTPPPAPRGRGGGEPVR